MHGGKQITTDHILLILYLFKFIFVSVVNPVYASRERLSGRLLSTFMSGESNKPFFFINLSMCFLSGKSARYCQGLYFRMKDLVFKGPRPYDSEPLERFLRQEFGDNVKMTSILHPR